MVGVGWQNAAGKIGDRTEVAVDHGANLRREKHSRGGEDCIYYIGRLSRVVAISGRLEALSNRSIAQWMMSTMNDAHSPQRAPRSAFRPSAERLLLHNARVAGPLFARRGLRQTAARTGFCIYRLHTFMAWRLRHYTRAQVSLYMQNAPPGEQ
jgi:hypothetical protein